MMPGDRPVGNIDTRVERKFSRPGNFGGSGPSGDGHRRDRRRVDVPVRLRQRSRARATARGPDLGGPAGRARSGPVRCRALARHTAPRRARRPGERAALSAETPHLRQHGNARTQRRGTPRSWGVRKGHIRRRRPPPVDRMGRSGTWSAPGHAASPHERRAVSTADESRRRWSCGDGTVQTAKSLNSQRNAIGYEEDAAGRCSGARARPPTSSPSRGRPALAAQPAPNFRGNTPQAPARRRPHSTQAGRTATQRHPRPNGNDDQRRRWKTPASNVIDEKRLAGGAERARTSDPGSFLSIAAAATAMIERPVSQQGLGRPARCSG